MRESCAPILHSHPARLLIWWGASHAWRSQSEYLKAREGLRRLDRSAKDCRASRRMDSNHGCAKASSDRDGARHRIGYFVKLEIEEHILSLTHKPPNDRRDLGSEQLEAHFVRCGSSAKLFDKCLGFRFTAEVQRDDDPVICIHAGDEGARGACNDAQRLS